jgi:hypothetical protein
MRHVWKPILVADSPTAYDDSPIHREMARRVNGHDADPPMAGSSDGWRPSRTSTV